MTSRASYRRPILTTPGQDCSTPVMLQMVLGCMVRVRCGECVGVTVCTFRLSYTLKISWMNSKFAMCWRRRAAHHTLCQTDVSSWGWRAALVFEIN